MTTPTDPADRDSAHLLPARIWAVPAALLRRAFSQLLPLAPTLVALALVCVLTTAALWALSAYSGLPMALLTRDMVATLGGKFYIGVLSNAGALLWSASATVCLFAATVLYSRPAHREAARFLAGAGVLVMALGADDFFLLHENVYPKLGLEEHWVVMLYAAGLVFLVLRFYRVVLASDALLLFIGGALFAASAAVDAFVIKDATALEDIPKFSGILFWLTYFWRLALARLRAADRPHG